MRTEDTQTACVSRISMLTMPAWSLFFHGRKDPVLPCFLLSGAQDIPYFSQSEGMER